MNNIYKVIWSKAKNCYVVASEIAKSHTKSASGSEKMGGYGKKALLALAAAAAIFCGGLVNVGAVDTVHVDESGTPLTAHEVYTKDAVDTTFATKTEVNAKADNTTVTEQGTKITQLETAVGNTYTKAEADGKFATSDALNTAKTDLEGKITANTTKITDLSGRMTTAENNITDLKDADVRLEGKIDQNANDITGLKDKDTELSGKIDVNKAAIDQNKADITQNKNDITTINGKLTTAEGNIATNQNAIAELKTKVGTVNNGTYLDSSKTVGENLNKLNDGLVKEVADRKVADTALSGRITANANTIAEVNQQLVNTNNHFNTELRNTNAALQAEGKARAEADAKINTKIGNIDDTRTAYVKDANSISQNLTTLDEKLQDTNDRTGGIKRNTEDTQTTIEDSVKVDKQGNVKDVNELSAKTITTTGNADLKGNVTLGTTAANTVTVNGTADFNEAVKMNNGLNVINGETNLKNTTVDGDLKVTGTITTDKMVFGDKPTNYTEIDHGKVTSKNLEVNGAGQAISSSSIFNAEENKVGFANNATGDQSFHKQTSDIIMDNVKDRDNSNYRTQTKTETKDIITDKDGNSSTTSQTARENKTYLKDKDGKNTNSTIDTAKGYDKTIKGENGETSTKQDELNITNTAQKGTIKNDAMNIENNANGDMTNTVGGKLTTTVTGQATENFNGGLDTNVTGKENHTVTGDQNIHVTGKQTNEIGGDQVNIIGGNQTTTVTGDILNTAKNITNAATETLTDKVGTNTRVINSTSITDTVGTTTNRKIEDGKITDTAGDSTVTTENGKGTTFAKTTSAAYSTKAGAPMDTNIAGNHITTGRVDANELGVSDEDGANTADFSVKAGEGVKASAGDGNTKGSMDVTAEEVGSTVKDASGKGSTFKQRIDAIMGNVKTDAGESEVTQKGDEITSKVGLGEATNSRVTQKKDLLEAAVTDGTNYNISNDTANESAKELRGGTKVNRQYDNLNGSQKTITNGTYTTSKLQTALDITNTAEYGTITNDAKNIVNNATGDMTNTVGGNQTNKIDGDQVNTIGGSQTTTVEGKVTENYKAGQATNVTGDQDITISGTQTTTATDINRNASSGMIDTIDNDYGTNTETKIAGKTTTDVSIKGTGEEGKYIRGANESRDYLIKGTLMNSETKTAEATTTEITDGNGKTSATIQDVTQISGSVKEGTNTSVQKQTASAIAADVKDGAGNENASVANATTSANTITNGTKANTVISTADGTSFINSEAAAPVTGASGAGTAVNTTIKGNTITTGKVTMDYAEVKKDLGVHGNAKVDQNLEVGGTSTLKGDVTMESNAKVKKDLTVEGNTNLKNTKVDGTLEVTQRATFRDDVDIAKNLSVGGNATITGDVTARSYNVDGKTYIDANGINANNQKITNVADGSISEGSKDAVNGGQLYGVKRDLEHQVDKVGANAAAMANLRPMEFDPSSKWNIAAAIGNYGSETAAALGAFYRPNDDVMVNLSTAFGTGENMVGGGVSVRLGKGGNKLSREENNALKDQVNDLTARMDALLSVLNPNMSKDFPDVPENHWAYEAVSRLAGNDIVQGYPDGEFHGERTMTRYEMAEIIYNALSRGAEAERELVEEFKPELQAMAASEKATAEKAEG